MNKATTAQRLADRFYTLGNGNVCFLGDDETDYRTLLDMTYAASRAGVSSDYAYSMVWNVLTQIADMEPDDLEDTDVSNLVDVYDADRMRFISDGLNWCFADQAREEYGSWPDDFMEIVGLAQDFAYREVLNAIIAEWPEEEEKEEAEEAN